VTNRINRRAFLRRGLGTTLGAGLGLALLGENKAHAGYPNYCFALKVPWLPQVPPGTWDGTKHCGQTCCVMLAAYLKGLSVSSSKITDVDKWLAQRFNDNRYLDVNGYFTNFSGRNELGAILSAYYCLNYGPACGSDPSAVVNQAAAGRPCIVGVEIGGVKPGVLSATGDPKKQHWALVIGWDGRVILNDPGTGSGSGIPYSVAAFDASWATSGRTYAPVWK
jgi:hypothetical protein